MNDLDHGIRDKRGDWRPNAALQVGPLLDFPWSPLRVLNWLPSYFLPWNVVFMGIGAVFWFTLTPPRETLQMLDWSWVLYLYVRNSLLVLLIYGALELRLYVKRAQGNRFKFNGMFPSDKPSDVFWFKSQNLDNAIRGFASGVPIWTAYEVLMLWTWANGIGPWTMFGDNPAWLAVFALAIPLIHEVHFFCIHRLIHIPVLYKWVHSAHHNSINPSPWSSLSMHPVEHLLYWSGSLIHLILPSHPLLAIYHLNAAGAGAVIGHIGFDKIEAGKEGAMDTHAYTHYLHHKYFEVNYADGTLPIDKWFGTWHDGSKECEARMQARYEKKVARMNANQQQNS
jgi:sterol desaturase/sphingolipid hydroxylase (fatty acid hydroxylase superfamily)